MRRAFALLVLTLALAVPAQAFDGYEHRSVSNAAVLVAARYAEGRGDAEFIARARELAGRQPNSFGDLTVAVDWFQDVTKLTRAEAFGAVGKRQRFYMAWLKGLSLHRNTLHFQRQALCAYLTLHRHAMELAAVRDKWDDALFTEAVALHFLQDFFSAGHFITPRKHSHDAVAGSLHDHFGRSGLMMKVELSNDGQLIEPWRSLAADAVAEIAGVRSLEVPFVAADLQTLDAVHELRVGGDTCLNEVPGQRELVLLMSAKSIAEVMAASRPSGPTGERIDACFSQRWAQPDSSNSSIESTDPKKRGLPQGAFRLTGSKPAPPGDVTLDFLRSRDCEKQVPRCEEPEAWPIRYAVVKEDYGETSLYDAKGLQFTVAGLPAVRRSISIGTIVGGYDPRNAVDVYDEQSHPTDREFSRILQPLYGAAHLSFVEGANYRAIGGRIELAFDIPSPIGMTVMLGPNVYKWTRHNATRIDGGLKLTYGVEVVNVVLLLERGHQVDDRGRFHQHYFATPGVELTLSNSWLHALFGRKSGRCCK